MPKTSLELDYAASFTPGTATTATAMTALAVTTTATWATPPWLVLAIGGTILAIAAAVVSRTRATLNKPHKVPMALSGTWALWTGYAVTAYTLNPYTYTWATWWSIAAAFITLTAITYVAYDKADIADEAHFAENLHRTGTSPDDTLTKIEALKGDRVRHDLARTWIGHINDTLKITPTVTGLTNWDPINGTSPGFTLALDLPKGSSSRDFTSPIVQQLAENAGLPNGCTITTAKGTRQGQILLHIETTPPTDLVHHHRADWTPLTINQPLPWVFTPHGHDISVAMREAGALIVGPPGTGKTTLLNVIMSTFARCTDVLAWGIDTGKHGLAFRHWTTDLPPGSKPVITRVGKNNKEALALVEAAQREATARVHHYAQWMKDNDTDLVPISRDCPMLFLIFDEAAEIFAADMNDPIARKLCNAVLQLMRTTRQAGIRTIFTFVDINASASMGSTDLNKFSPIKIALTGDGTTANTDAVHRFWGTPKGVDLQQITAKGAGIGNFGTGPVVFRGPLTKPSMVAECTINTSHHRPPQDLVCTTWAGDPLTATTDDAPTHQPIEWTLTDSENLRNEIATMETQFTPATPDPDNPLGWLHEAAADTATRTTQPDPDDELTGWRKLVLHHLSTNPDRDYSTSDLVSILAETYGQTIARQTLSTQLTAWATEGTIAAIGAGAHRTYTHTTPTTT